MLLCGQIGTKYSPLQRVQEHGHVCSNINLQSRACVIATTTALAVPKSWKIIQFVFLVNSNLFS